MAAYEDDGVQVLDISDSANPPHVGSFTDNGTTLLNGVIDIEVVGQYAYVTGQLDNALQILDISDPTNITHVGNIAG